MEYNFCTLVVTVQLRQAVPDVLYRLSATFPDAFLQVAGAAVHREVFSRQLSSDPEAVRRHQKPPLPFAFAFPAVAQGERIALRLTLVGRAIHRLAFFLAALRLLLERGEPASGSILGVESQGFDGTLLPVEWEGGGPETAPAVLCAADFLQEVPQLHELQLSLLSPLRLVEGGRGAAFFDFSLFFRTLLRRVSSLGAAYCGVELEADYPRLAAASRTAVASGSFRRHDRSGSRLYGITGEGIVRGELAELYPFLRLGEFLNCGKGAAYGLGRFSAVPRSLQEAEACD